MRSLWDNNKYLGPAAADGQGFRSLMSFVAGAAAGLSLSLADVVTVSNSSTITVPAGIVTGQIGVVIHSVITANSSSDIQQAPSGWTQIYANSGTYIRNSAHYKVLSSSDSGASLSINYSSAGSSDTQGATLFIFDTGISAPTVTASTLVEQFSSNGSNVGPITVTAGSASSANCLVFGATMAWGVTAPVFSSASPSFDATQGGELETGYKIYNNNPANHTIDSNLSTSYENWIGGFYLEVSE